MISTIKNPANPGQKTQAEIEFKRFYNQINQIEFVFFTQIFETDIGYDQAYTEASRLYLRMVERLNPKAQWCQAQPSYFTKNYKPIEIGRRSAGFLNLIAHSNPGVA